MIGQVRRALREQHSSPVSAAYQRHQHRGVGDTGTLSQRDDMQVVRFGRRRSACQALRETEEEIGLSRARVRVLGRLPDYEIPSGFRITPVVGWIEPPFDLTLDPFEVEAVFEAPLAHFLDAANYQRRQYHFRGRHRHYMAIPYEGRYIWGATAGMLYSLCRMLKD